MPGTKLLWDSQGHVTASSAAPRIFMSLAVLSLSLSLSLALFLSLSLMAKSPHLSFVYQDTHREKQRGLLKYEE